MCEGKGDAAPGPASARTIRPRDAHMPARPAIPVTLWALLATILSERAVLRWGGLPSAHSLKVAALAAASCFVPLGMTVLLVRRGGREKRMLRVPTSVPLVLVAAIAGACLGVLSLGRVSAAVDALSAFPVSSWTLEVEGDMVESSRGWWGRARVLGDNSQVGSVWLSSPTRLESGDKISCVGRFRPNDNDEWGVSSRMQGVAGTVSVVRVTSSHEAEGPLGAVLRVRRAVLASFSPYESDGAAVLAGSVCGDRAPIRSRRLDEAFSTCGVSHLVAVSGGHLAILTGVISALLGKSRLRPFARGTLGLGAVALFIVFCGAPASAVRAGIMSCVSFVGTMVGRRSHALSSACAAALAMALLDPYVSGQLGFLLSVASVVGISLFGTYASHAFDVLMRPRRYRGRRLSAVAHASQRLWSSSCDALGVSMVAQLFTLPLTCPAFGEVALIAPIANLLLGPLFAVVVSLGLGAAVLAPLPVLQGPILIAAKGVSQAFCVALTALSRIPMACVPMEMGEVTLIVALGIACAVLYVAWPAPSRRHMVRVVGVLAGAFVSVLFCLRFLQPARVCVLDVGQGDAILVADGGAAVLVDTGPDGAVSQALARQGIVHLDAIVLTHLHDDHVGGVDDLVGRLGCERVLVARGVVGEASGDLARGVRQLTGRDAEEISYGDTVRTGSFSLRMVSPTKQVDGSENADSVILALSYEQGGRTLTALLTGDAERDETGACLARGDVGDIDFLKVGHHGSEISVTTEEAEILDPEVSVASAGEGNRYGHPNEKCVSALEGAGSVFLCTKDVGCVTVRPGEKGPLVSSERPVGEMPEGLLASGM